MSLQIHRLLYRMLRVQNGKHVIDCYTPRDVYALCDKLLRNMENMCHSHVTFLIVIHRNLAMILSVILAYLVFYLILISSANAGISYVHGALTTNYFAFIMA